MALSEVPLATSSNKSVFMERLKLDPYQPEHARIYKHMKVKRPALTIFNAFVTYLEQADAVDAYRQITGRKDALLPDLVDDPTIVPPYRFQMITQKAIWQAVQSIHFHADPLVRPYYELGCCAETGDNWVIQWMLWHVFRYRDNRNFSRSSNARPLLITAEYIQQRDIDKLSPVSSTNSPVEFTHPEIDARADNYGLAKSKAESVCYGRSKLLPYDPVRD